MGYVSTLANRTIPLTAVRADDTDTHALLNLTERRKDRVTVNERGVSRKYVTTTDVYA